MKNSLSNIDKSLRDIAENLHYILLRKKFTTSFVEVLLKIVSSDEYNTWINNEAKGRCVVQIEDITNPRQKAYLNHLYYKHHIFYKQDGDFKAMEQELKGVISNSSNFKEFTNLYCLEDFWMSIWILVDNFKDYKNKEKQVFEFDTKNGNKEIK